MSPYINKTKFCFRSFKLWLFVSVWLSLFRVYLSSLGFSAKLKSPPIIISVSLSENCVIIFCIFLKDFFSWLGAYVFQ